ncbi:MAG TPA: XRE family transcriptional regulator [Acidimicrobiales bacterium]|jgi:transcriptional regulator with XRE-family HTH domain
MELSEVLTSIAESLRERRLAANLTLEQLASEADLSVAHVSRLESGDRQPSIAALISLARALHIPVSALLGEQQKGDPISTFGGADPAHEANGLSIVGCSGFPGSSVLEALRITIEVDREPPTPARHRGEEWVFVLAGRLQLEFDGAIYPLHPGESAHFDATVPHRLGADGVTTEVLVVAADAPADLRTHPLFSRSIDLH